MSFNWLMKYPKTDNSKKIIMLHRNILGKGFLRKWGNVMQNKTAFLSLEINILNLLLSHLQNVNFEKLKVSFIHYKWSL